MQGREIFRDWPPEDTSSAFASRRDERGQAKHDNPLPVIIITNGLFCLPKYKKELFDRKY